MVGRKRSLVSWRAEQRTRKCFVSSGPELHNIQVGSTSSLLNLERLDCDFWGDYHDIEAGLMGAGGPGYAVEVEPRSSGA